MLDSFEALEHGSKPQKAGSAVANALADWQMCKRRGPRLPAARKMQNAKSASGRTRVCSRKGALNRILRRVILYGDLGWAQAGETAVKSKRGACANTKAESKDWAGSHGWVCLVSVE